MKNNKLRLLKKRITLDQFKLEFKQSNQKLKKYKWQSSFYMLTVLATHCIVELFNYFSFYYTLIPFGLMIFTLFGLFWIKGKATLSSVKSSSGIFPW